MRRTMILGVCLLASLAACSGETPAGVRAPEGPRYDGGWTMGSGGGSVGGAEGTSTTTSDSTATARSGWLVGSGN